MSNGTAPFLTDEQKTILRKSALCAKLSEDQADYFFQVVERTRLDPFLGQIRPDVRRSKNDEGVKELTLLIITTLAGLRLIGDRTKQHDGESPVEWSDKEGNWKEVWLSEEPPAAARSSVYRKDRSHPQVSIVNWEGMVQMVYDRNGKTVPNPFWRKMGPHMLGKCSLAGAYRGAYPDASGLYISEELGEELDPDSEQAIEAEMVRRAREEKEYWDKEREQGRVSIDEQQRLEKEAAASKPATVQQELPVAGAASAPEKPKIKEPAPAPLKQAPLEELKPQPKLETVESSFANGSYMNFPITRIELFKDRTVGSLTSTEMKGLAPWLKKVEEAWVNLDDDFKAHYRALKQRVDDDYQKELESLADNLDFGSVESK